MEAPVSELKLSWLLVLVLCIALLGVLAPSYGILGGLAGIGVCFLGAALGGGPFLLYAIWRDRK
jgi:hypothetical protein